MDRETRGMLQPSEQMKHKGTCNEKQRFLHPTNVLATCSFYKKNVSAKFSKNIQKIMLLIA